MKNFRHFKLFQAIFFGLGACASLYYLLTSGTIEESVGFHPPILILCMIIWIFCLSSCIFILIDLRLLQKYDAEYLSLSNLTYRDELTGLPNRTSCDNILFQILREGRFDDIGFVLLHLDNLEDTNEVEGYDQGDRLLENFAGLLSQSGLPFGNVVRNNAVNFALITSNCDLTVLEQFSSDLKKRVSGYNEKSGGPIILYSACLIDNHEKHFKTPSELVGYASHHLQEIL